MKRFLLLIASCLILSGMSLGQSACNYAKNGMGNYTNQTCLDVTTLPSLAPPASVLQTVTIYPATPAAINSGQIQLGTTLATHATDGGGEALPAHVAGYVTVTINGTVFKIPYYAN